MNYKSKFVMCAVVFVTALFIASVFSSMDATAVTGTRQGSGNDANSGKDAGSTMSSAVSISGPKNTYSGTLPSGDTKDMYKISLSASKMLKVTLDVPTNANFDLEITSSSGTVYAKSINAIGIDEEAWYRAEKTGTYGVRIVKISGDGSYSFTVNVIDSPVAKWTVMMYMSADSEIDSSVDYDFSQMKQVGSTNDFNLITLTDKSGNGDTKAYRVLKGSLSEIPLTVINPTWGKELDMSDINNVIAFTNFCFKYYPSTYKMLIFWSHSRGGLTVGYDPDRGDNIDFAEMSAAMTKIKSNNKSKKIDIVGYDACWSHNIATAYQLAPYANYIVGGESTSGGWRYQVAFSYIANNPSKTPREVAAYIGNNIASYNMEATGATDLSKMSTLISKIKTLATKLNGIADSQKSTLWYVRQHTQEYDPHYDAPYIDLYDFCAKLAVNFTTSDWTTLLNDIKALCDKDQAGSAVIGSANYGAPGSHGLGIMFPAKASKYYGYEYTFKKGKFTTDTQWDEFLTNFYN